jgi:hypothetical protein
MAAKNVVPVKFRGRFRNYYPGDVAGFGPELASQIVNSNLASYVHKADAKAAPPAEGPKQEPEQEPEQEEEPRVRRGFSRRRTTEG